MNKHKRFVEELLAKADICVNGERPWDLQIHDDRTFSRSLAASFAEVS